MKHETKGEKVKHYLLDCILNKSKYKPGDKITETKIARKLNISQAPVREAIKDLQVMGFVESEPYKGSYIKQMSSKELKEAYEVRVALEGVAIRQAIKHITSEQLNKMQSVVTEMASCIENEDYLQFTKLDRKFHNIIIKASNNSMLKKVWDNVGIEYWTWRGLKFLKENQLYDFDDQVERHQAIYNVIKNKNSEKAESIIKEHFPGKLVDQIELNRE